MYSFSFWFGVALAIIGCLMLFYSREHAGTNEVGVFGMHFRLSHPALVIFVLGVLLVIREGDGAIPFDVTDAEEQRVPPPDSPTDPALSIGSATGVVAADTTVPAPAGNGAAATALDSRPAPQPSTYAAGLAPSADAVASVDAADAASHAAFMEELAAAIAADAPATDAATADAAAAAAAASTADAPVGNAAAAAAAAAARPTGGENSR